MISISYLKLLHNIDNSKVYDTRDSLNLGLILSISSMLPNFRSSSYHNLMLNWDTGIKVSTFKEFPTCLADLPYHHLECLFSDISQNYPSKLKSIKNPQI